MSQTAIPADEFLDMAISALIRTDSDNLRMLESQAVYVVAPRNVERFSRNQAVFAVLLDASARNLRLLRRVAGNMTSDLYHSC